MTTGTLRLATRGSDLALRQAAGVRDELSTRRRDVELVEVETRGDRLDEDLITELGRTGAFVRALDEEVLSGEVDAAVHSLKDMPTDMPDGLVVAAVGERAPAGDALVTREGGDLADLPRGSVVGTSSLRRKAQVLAERPDLEVRPLRGNVDTRLQKLIAPALQAEHERRVEAEADHKGDPGAREEDSEARSASDSRATESSETAKPSRDDGSRDAASEPSRDREYERTVEEWFDDRTEFQRAALEHEVDHEYDAIVLAEAGLRRSDLFYRDEYEVERLDRADHVPAPGQGAVAVTASDPDVIDAIRSAMDHEPTRVATSVERTILAELGGGCIAPIGVNALVQGEHVSARVRVLSADGDTEVKANRDLPLRTYREGAAEFAGSLRDQGAAELIEAAKRAADTETAKRVEEGDE
ncbi:hydroxymethylbilane synthase [Halobaculum rubrum]|uniref:hydroxymethylbilane synthase n=1 Tax=Halobaculum rubrum TaxID=2872158 RepID=UPI001CA408A8|nr:hydroxymethylbilane synthase [Halobaculum rubrum]QZY00687.1 hydroxymethylbilane synthase [Halobaculum rubrum]